MSLPNGRRYKIKLVNEEGMRGSRILPGCADERVRYDRRGEGECLGVVQKKKGKN